MKFCKVIAGCVCAAACLMMSVQAEPSVNVTVNATVPHIFEIDDALEVDGDDAVELINRDTGLPAEDAKIKLKPKYSGRAKIRISSLNGDGANCRVKAGDDKYLNYIVSYDGHVIDHNQSSADIDLEKDNSFEIKFALAGNQDLEAGVAYQDTLTVSLVAPEVAAPAVNDDDEE